MAIRDIQDAIAAFADERDWGQFHTPRSLILAMQSELGELAELVQWARDDQIDDAWLSQHRTRLSEEIADVFIYLARLADVVGIDVESSTLRKIQANAERYPVEKSRGNSRKYTEL